MRSEKISAKFGYPFEWGELSLFISRSGILNFDNIVYTNFLYDLGSVGIGVKFYLK